jgi:hypothetical protein
LKSSAVRVRPGRQTIGRCVSTAVARGPNSRTCSLRPSWAVKNRLRACAVVVIPVIKLPRSPALAADRASLFDSPNAGNRIVLNVAFKRVSSVFDAPTGRLNAGR